MENLLEVNELVTQFKTRGGVVKAVNGVSFAVKPGETLGIVGESGSGKSVTMMSVLGLIPTPPGEVINGTALFQGQDLLKMNQEQLRRLRGNRISMIFQDPMTSLNPYLRLEVQLTEGLLVHNQISKAEARRKAIEVLEQVGIPEAEKRLKAYPHELSGGMCQRVMIAIALITEPDLLIADEPTTALDATVQAQILDLLVALQKKKGTAVIMITHDLGVVARVSDRVMIMYAGNMVEQGGVDDIFASPKHPYTQGLLRSLPQRQFGGEAQDQLYSIPGLPPDPSRLPTGCPFAPRCDFAKDVCRSGAALPIRTYGAQHVSRCTLEVIP